MRTRKSRSIIRIRRRSTPFVTLDKRFLADPRLSWGAKGLLAYLLAKPDDWTVMMLDLVRQSIDGHASCRARLAELELAGYVRRMKVRDRRSGRLLRWETVVFEVPELAASAEDRGGPTLFEQFEIPATATKKPRFQRNTPEVDFPHLAEQQVAEPHLVHPHVENRTLLMNDERKNDQPNNDETEAAWADRNLAGAGKPHTIGLMPGPVPSSLGEDPDSFVVVTEPDDPPGSPDRADPTDDPVRLLVGRGFSHADAGKLVSRALADGDRVREVLAHSRGKGKGFVAEALRKGWTFDQPPPAMTDRVASRRSAMAAAERDRELREEMASIDRTIDGLPDAEWASLVDRVKPSLGDSLRQRIASDGPGAVRLARIVREMVYRQIRLTTPGAAHERP